MRRLTWIMLVLSVMGSGCASGTVAGESTLADDVLPSTEAAQTDTTSTSTPSTMPASTEPLVAVLSPFTEDSVRPGEQEAFVYVSADGIEMEYLLYLPDGHDPNMSWPVILSLHGFLGFEDQTIGSVRDWNPLVWVDPSVDFPFVLISPLQPESGLWQSLHGPLQELLGQLEDPLGLDTSAVFLTGLSTGAFGTWQWALEYPDSFAGIAPVEGTATLGGDPVPEGVCRLVDLPVWAGHGEGSPQLPREGHAAVVDALGDCGSTVAQFTVYEGLDHLDSIVAFYTGPDLYDWMLQTASGGLP